MHRLMLCVMYCWGELTLFGGVYLLPRKIWKIPLFGCLPAFVICLLLQRVTHPRKNVHRVARTKTQDIETPCKSNPIWTVVASALDSSSALKMTEDAIDTVSAMYALYGWAFVIAASALIMATGLSGSPLDQLGLRPKGSGLWSWVYYYYVDSVGINGYDCILGAMSPSLRIQFHGSGVLFLWGTIVFCSGNAETDHYLWNIPATVWWAGFQALSAYLSIFFVAHHVMDGVAMPGGPRAAKIQRMPSWEDKTTSLDDKDKNKWKCMVAEESHQNTERKFLGNKLTGEASGRQIWTTDDTSKDVGDRMVSRLWKQMSGDNINEDLVETMAQGGRSSSGFNPSKNPNSCDVIFRAQQIREYLSKDGNKPPSTEPAKTVNDAMHKAAHFYSMLQSEDGHWAADYGGPHFLMPGLITAWYVMGKPNNFLDKDQIKLMTHYILVHQQKDGGWGTHIESPSTMFGSTLMYVAMRLMGVPIDHPAAIKGRQFLKDNGGALYTSSWSKFYLCLLGLMDWRGHNSVPPEMWLLPNWCPFHPGRMWCHARMVYLPMGYLYGSRFVYSKAETDETIQSLRDELYCEPYAEVTWVSTRNWVSDLDNYSPIPWVMKMLQSILARYENWDIFQPFKNAVREKGIKFSMLYMHAEDNQTNYIEYVNAKAFILLLLTLESHSCASFDHSFQHWPCQ